MNRRAFIIFTLLLSFASISYSTQTQPVSFDLKIGEEGVIPGTDIHFRLTKIKDLEATGCLGGPIGCGIMAFVEFDRKKEKKEVVFRGGKSAAAQKNRTAKSVVFNYRVVLEKITPKQVTLSFVREN